jgi:thymidylate synthase
MGVEEYLDLVETVLTDGDYKEPRGHATISTPQANYMIDLRDGFPLLTTKQMSDFRWNSMVNEIAWYLSGEHHIRTLHEHSNIWDAWADDDGNLDTAYGRFWRRYPLPEQGLDGEAWPDETHPHVTREDNGELVFDQIAHALDELENNPESRRIHVNADHPANRAVSTLPPCHFDFGVNVQNGDELYVTVAQRSGDTALGIPFNDAAYAIINHLFAQSVDRDLEPRGVGRTIYDAHIYAGTGDRAAFYKDAENREALQRRVSNASEPEEYRAVKDWLEDVAPPEPGGDEHRDHVPGLLEQLAREPFDRPTLELPDVPITEFDWEAAAETTVRDYESHPPITYAIAE